MLRSTRIFRFISVAVFALFVGGGCSDDPTGSGLTTYTLETLRGEASPYGVLRFGFPDEIPAPSAHDVAHLSVNGKSLSPTISTDGSLVLVVPDVEAGTYTLDIGGSHQTLGKLTFTVLSPVVVADPDATVNEVVAAMGALLDEMDASETAGIALNSAFARAALDDFLHQWEQASSDEQLAVATYLEANPDILSALQDMSEGVAASRMLVTGEDTTPYIISKAIALGAATVLLQDMVAATVGTCQASLGGGVVGAAFGCAPVAVTFSAAVATAAGTMHYTAEGVQRIKVATKDLIVRFIDWASDDGEMVAAHSGTTHSSDGPVLLYNNETAAFDVDQPQRSVRRSDVENATGIYAEFLSMALRMEEFLVNLRSWYESLADMINFGSAEPSSQTTLFPDTETADTLTLEAGEFAIQSVSNENVQCAITGAGEHVELTCTTHAEEDQEFYLTFVRETEFGVARGEVEAILVLSDAIVAIADGNQQTAYPGDPLAEPLRVQVSSEESASTEGTLVLWEVTEGNGVVSSDTSYADANGVATVSWTLGAEEGTQAVQASAFIDGVEVGGSPVTFMATADRGMMLQEMSGNNQMAASGQELGDPLVVRVVDSQAQIVENAQVGWEVVSGSGTLSATTTQTDASGETSVRWTLGDGEAQSVEVSVYDWQGEHVEGSPHAFTATLGSDGSLVGNWDLRSLDGENLPVTVEWDACWERLNSMLMELYDNGDGWIEMDWSHGCEGGGEEHYEDMGEFDWWIDENGEVNIYGVEADFGFTTPFEFNGSDELILMSADSIMTDAPQRAVFDRR